MNKKICILILLLYFSNYENISAQNPVLNFKLKQKSSLFKSSALYSSLQSNSNIVTIDELEYAGNFLNSSIGQVMCQDSSSLQEVMNILENNPDIEWVEENKRLRVFQTGLPNDTLLNRQWHWFTVGADYLYANDYFENNNVKIPIAIIDTGVDYQHSDLAGQFWINSSEDINSNNRLDEDDINGIDDDRNGIIDDVIGYDFTDAPDFPAAGDYLTEDPFPMDDYGSSGHGTPVAGLIAAKTDNITGIAGISPNAEIMVLRAGSASGYLEVDDVVKAIFYAVDNGAKIINMSFGDSYPSQFLHQAVRYAFDNGVVQVAAAGNSGNNLPNYPAAWPEVLGIASINSNNHRSGFSNYGSWISFSLPGESVLSTATNDNYTLVNGTSFACPIAVAVISLPLSQVMANGDININSFYSQLETKSVQLGGEAFNNDFGYGLLKFPGVLQSETLEISIQSPNSFQTIVGNSLPLIATVWGANIKNYSFKIKLNNEELWQSTTYTRFVFNDTLEIIDISSFPEDTLLTLTVVIRTYDNELLYKISPFKISNTIPGLEELKHIEWWNRAIQGDFIKITSNVKCNASITAFDEENELRFTQPSEGSGTEHYFTVNETNNYSIKFELQNSAGSSGFVPDTIVLLKAENNILPGMPYKNSIQFPYAGFTIDTLTDFNNNGLPEIIFSKSGADTVYGILTAAEIYETNDSLQYQIMASTKKPFIPRSIGDVNGDGKAEIFAGYGAKIYLLSDIDGDNFPFETAWKDTIDNWAVYLKDFEQDGIYEGIVRKNNEYQIWKWDNSFQPSVLYNFELPEEETPLYSVPNVLFADLEGDGAKEVIIGDFNGNLFIFKQDDLYSYRFIQKIATGYQAVTDHIITDDINSDGADELYFIHSVIPDAQSDQLMNYSYWQLNKLELVENELKLSTLFNFKGVQLSSHFFNGLQKIDGYLVITMSPHQYWVKFEDGAQPIFFEDFININKIYTGNLAGDSILIGSIDEKLAVKKIFSHNQNNFLSHTDFFQKSDTIIHAEWKWQLPEIDTIHIKIKKDSQIFYENDFTGNNEIDIAVSLNDNEYTCEFQAMKNGLVSQQITRNITSHTKPNITITPITFSPYLLKLNCEERLDSKKLTTDNFILKNNKLKPSQINLLNNNQTILLLFENLTINQDSLYCLNIRDQKGYLFDVSFYMDFTEEHNLPFYPEYAIINGREQIIIEFNREIQKYNLADSTHFKISPQAIITGIQKNNQIPNQLIIYVNKSNNLGGYGSRGTISIQNVESIDNTIMANGNIITLPLMNKVETLNKTVIFPNPFKNKTHNKFIAGNVPYGTQMKIISINGELLYQTEELSGSGSLKINIKKELPELVSGVYIVVLSHKGKSKLKKWFFIK